MDEGALIAAGSDCNVSFFDPLLSIWGLVTRGMRTVGVQVHDPGGLVGVA